WDRAAFWIARYRDFFERLLAGLDYPLAKPLSLPLSAAAFLKDGMVRGKPRRGDIEVQDCPEFDGRFFSFSTTQPIFQSGSSSRKRGLPSHRWLQSSYVFGSRPKRASSEAICG